MDAQVMCLETAVAYPDAEAAAQAHGIDPSDVLDACMGRQARAGGLSWALVAGGWVLAYEERPTARLVRKWTVDEHARIIEASRRPLDRQLTAPGGDRDGKRGGRGASGN